MDRRFICPGCGVKWFISKDHPHVPDLTHCAACGEPLVAFAGPPPDSVVQHELTAFRRSRAAG